MITYLRRHLRNLKNNYTILNLFLKRKQKGSMKQINNTTELITPHIWKVSISINYESIVIIIKT